MRVQSKVTVTNMIYRILALEEEIYTKQIIKRNLYYKCLWLRATKKKKIKKKKEGHFVLKIIWEDAWLGLENEGKRSLIFKQIIMG